MASILTLVSLFLSLRSLHRSTESLSDEAFAAQFCSSAVLSEARDVLAQLLLRSSPTPPKPDLGYPASEQPALQSFGKWKPGKSTAGFVRVKEAEPAGPFAPGDPSLNIPAVPAVSGRYLWMCPRHAELAYEVLPQRRQRFLPAEPNHMAHFSGNAPPQPHLAPADKAKSGGGCSIM